MIIGTRENVFCTLKVRVPNRMPEREMERFGAHEERQPLPRETRRPVGLCSFEIAGLDRNYTCLVFKSFE